VSPILGILASSQQGALAVGDYESIATTTVGAGGTASITFSSIPSTYTHLQIRGIIRNDASGGGGAEATLQFNSNTSNYVTLHQIYGSGSSAVASSDLTQPSRIYPSFNPKSGATANVFSGFVMDILDYGNTNKNKTVRTLSGWDANGDGFIIFRSGMWMNTSAISSITIGMESTFNFAQYSSFALYGIKG
jgi:hypothetical protein